jgi:AmmeMemoRadiSam system protein A
MTSEPERLLLLHIARTSIAAALGSPAPAAAVPAALAVRRAGAFVSLHKSGALRGCVGHIEPKERLTTIVARCAVAASHSDPRFPPVRIEELPHLHIELSILEPPERVRGVGEIEVGRHGLIVGKDGRRGLLLPQVAVDRQWDRETFLAQTCRKAGLSESAWLDGATIWRFEAEVFGEVSGA